MAPFSTIQLPTGAQIPLLGLGTWLAKDDEKLRKAVHAAIDAGYRLFDTAFLYQTEASLGKALRECVDAGKVTREELFITTKLPFTAHSPDDVAKVFAQQLEALQVDYVDLYLIHCACAAKHKPDSFAPLIEDGSFVPDNVDHLDTWRALEKLYKQGKAKAIGLSNFNEEQIERICKSAEVKPHNLQVEAHVYFPQKELYDFCKHRGITMTAFAPLGSPGRKEFRPDGFWPEGTPIKDPVVTEVARRLGRTPAQVMLRYLVERGICVVPKSTVVSEIVENAGVFDFSLSESDIAELEGIHTRVRLFVFDYFGSHPCYPMKDQDPSKFEKVSFESF